MMNVRSFAALFIIFSLVSGCRSRPNRPDASLCVVIVENGHVYGDCENSAGEYREDYKRLLCTDPDSYGRLERYIDDLELRIRNCGRR